MVNICSDVFCCGLAHLSRGYVLITFVNVSVSIYLKHLINFHSSWRRFCQSLIFSSPDEWRRRYWELFNSVATAKFRDWSYEEEYRLLLMSALDLFTQRKDRKLRYRFADLEGVIFGIRTSLSDKHQIINIIEAKCKEEGRKTFEFSVSQIYLRRFHVGDAFAEVRSTVTCQTCGIYLRASLVGKRFGMLDPKTDCLAHGTNCRSD